MAAAMLTDTHALFVYVGAALWNIAMSVSRPSLGSLLPLLSETPELLTSANVGLGLTEALNMLSVALGALLVLILEPLIGLSAPSNSSGFGATSSSGPPPVIVGPSLR